MRTGYEVIRVPLEKGRATGEDEDFLTGFVMPSGDVWGRPAGVAVAKDGSLIVTDDGSNTVWRVRWGRFCSLTGRARSPLHAEPARSC